MTEQIALDLEHRLISLIGRRNKKQGPLSNLTDGGEGVSGIVFSEVEIERRRQASSGENNPMYGRATYGFKGKTHNDMSLELIRKKSAYKEVTPELRSKLSESTKKSWTNRKSKSQQVFINGKIYNSVRIAAKELGINKGTITYRCKSGDPNFRYID